MDQTGRMGDQSEHCVTLAAWPRSLIVVLPTRQADPADYELL
jgi:hypothetical protein